MATEIGVVEGVIRLRDEFVAVLKRSGDALKEHGDKMRQVGEQMSQVGTRLTAAVTLPIAGIGAAALKMATDAVESENLFEVSFGRMADAARTWSEDTSRALKLNEFELRRQSGVIFTMVEAMGLGENAAFDMATGITELAGDMASFFNLRPEEAFDKLRAGIVGETEPLRQLGILVDENTVKHAAYRNGIAAVGSELTQQQKVAARWVAIQEQTVKVNGDLARTLESPANRLRALRTQVEQTAIKFGIALLPMWERALDVGQSLADRIEGVVEMFADLPRPVQTAVVVLGGLLAAAGPVLLIGGQLLTAWGSFAAFLPTLGGSIGSVVGVLTGPVGWIAAGGALLLAWKPAREFLVDLGGRVISTLVDWVKTAIATMGRWWDATEEGRRFLAALARVIADDVVKWVQAGISMFKAFASQQLELAGQVKVLVVRFLEFKGVFTAVETAGRTVISVYKEMWDWGRRLVDRLLEMVGGIDGLVAVISVLRPEIGLGVAKLKEWAAAAKEKAAEGSDALSASALDLAVALEEQRLKATGSKSALDDVATSFGKATISSDEFGRAGNDIINLLTTPVFTNHAQEIGDNRTAYDLLKETIDTTGLSVLDYQDLLTRLSLALAEGVITQDQFDAAIERMGSTTDETAKKFPGLADAFSNAIAKMVLEGESLGDVIEALFRGRARQAFTEFLDAFSTGFQNALEEGKGFFQAIRSAWDDSASKMVNRANALSAGFAAASGEWTDIMIGAFTAIRAAMQKDFVSAAIAGAGTVIGLFKKLFGGSRKDINDWRKDISKAFDEFERGGGILEDLGPLIRTVVSAMTALDSRDAGKLFRENFEKLLDIAIELGDRGVQSLQSVVNAAKAAGVDMQTIARELEKVWSEAMRVLEERSQFLIDQSSNLLDGLQQLLGETGRVTREEIEFSAETILQAFSAMVAAGIPLTDILDQLGDTFDLIRKRGLEMGLDLGDEFVRLGEVFAILADRDIRNVIDRLEGMFAAAQAAGNMGLLTTSQFEALQQRLIATFDQLVASGLSGEEALGALAPQLQLLQDLMQLYGFEIDDVTKALLDQADAQGLLQDRGLTTEDILIKGFDRMLMALNELIRVMGGVPIQFETWADAAEDAAKRWNDAIGDMENPRGFDDPFGPDGNDPGGFQHGSGRFLDFGSGSPVMLHGREQVVTAGEGASLAAMVGGAIRRAQDGGGGGADLLAAAIERQTQLQSRMLVEQIATRTSLTNLGTRLAGVEARVRTQKARM